MADHDVSKMKVADLKRELKNRGLNVTGNKNDLVERLQSALIEGDVFDDTAISEELLDDNDDVLNDDELDEETKSYLNSTSAQDEDAILSSPKGSTSSKSPEHQSESSINAASAPTQQKKVVLKRKLLPSLSLTESETSNVGTESKVIKMTDSASVSESEDASKPSNGNTDGSLAKLSQLTMKERLELRAKKFGTPVSGDGAKVARAERFGLTTNNITTAASASTAAATSSSSSSSSNSITAQKTAVDVDLLKKRAERFGGSVSNTMVTIEQKEKLLKRQERFGAATTTVTGTVKTTTATPATTTQEANEFAEKAKLRLERFKTTA